MIEDVKVTVIVAVLNGIKTIENCLDSIISQKGILVELIVLDSCSTDGTTEVIKSKYLEFIDYFQSENDGGIYFAWNIGLSQVTGDWVCFLGADDAFIHETAIANMVSALAGKSVEVDLVLSNGILVNEKKQKVKRFGQAWDWSRVKRYVKFCHPGLLHKTKRIKDLGGFNTDYRICADYDLLLKFGPETKAIYVQMDSVYVGNTGISRSAARRAFEEHRRIQKHHGYVNNFEILLIWIIAHIKNEIRKAIGR